MDRLDPKLQNAFSKGTTLDNRNKISRRKDVPQTESEFPCQRDFCYHVDIIFCFLLSFL